MMRRSFFAATAAALALGGIVTAAPAVAEPRCPDIGARAVGGAGSGALGRTGGPPRDGSAGRDHRTR